MPPLSEVAVGNTVRIRRINTDEKIKLKLAEMGILRSDIKILRNSGTGPLLIDLKDIKLILGRDISRKIEVN